MTDLASRLVEEAVSLKEFIFSVIHRRIKNRSTADDIYQETLFKIWRSADSYDPSRSLKNWVATIATNEAIDYLIQDSRRKKRDDAYLTPRNYDHSTSDDSGFFHLGSEIETPEETATRQEESEIRDRMIKTSLEELDQNQQDAIRMRYWEEIIDYDIIGKRLGICKGTVKSTIYNAKKHLRRSLKTLSQN